MAQEEKPKQDVLDKKDTRVEPTSWGSVYGRVYDAETGAPIGKASIIAETDDGFVEKGKWVGVTDELGGYKVQAVLGRISHNFDIGRALLSSGIGMLFGSATNTTKRIDVAQVNVRASAPGYKTFEGQVVARSQNAGKFRIDMEPILLVKESSAGISVSATTWSAVRIVGVGAEPGVARKNDKVRLTANLLAFGKDPSKNLEVVAISKLWRGEKRLKLVPPTTGAQEFVFEGEYKVSGKEKYKAEPVYFLIKRSILDYDPNKSFRAAVVQIVTDPADEQIAVARTAAIGHAYSGRRVEAHQAFVQLGQGNPTVYDLQMWAYTAERNSDWKSAADAWRKLRSIDGDQALELEQSARTLYMAKEYEALVENFKPILDKSKPKDWSRVVPAAAVGHVGLALVKLKRIEVATKLNEDLLNWPQSGLEESVIEFRGALRLAEVETAYAKEPSSPAALADFGRALLDLGRYEEAVAKLQASLEADPNQQAVKRDLTWAAMQLVGAKPATLDLETAVAEAKAGLNLDKGKQKSKDFFSWNQYAVLLFALSEQQRGKELPVWQDTQGEAISALREALSLGRVGAKRASGSFNFQFGYIGGSQVAISGFAYPQANASFVLLDSLKKLRKNPKDTHALFNRASSLMDLGQVALAEDSLNALLAMKPDHIEAKFLTGLLWARKGSYEDAKGSFRAVLTANPLHPRANLMLSDLLAEDGDVAGAAESLAQHAKFYGDQRAKR